MSQLPDSMMDRHIPAFLRGFVVMSPGSPGIAYKLILVAVSAIIPPQFWKRRDGHGGKGKGGCFDVLRGFAASRQRVQAGVAGCG